MGSPVFDMGELESEAQYENGYTRETPLMRYFWEVVHALSVEEQKRFLCFCTGTDRVPIGGLG